MSNTLYNTIRQVANGYIIVDSRGNEQIAFTLLDAARLAGEPVTGTGYVVYANGYSVADLADVRRFAKSGEKISAIKKLRDCFTPRLGLREAKDLVEQLCG